MEAIINYLIGLNPVIPVVLSALGGLVVLGQSYIALTPTQADDKWYADLEKKPVIGQALEILKRFAPIQRK